MKKILLLSLSTTLCLTFMIGCTKSSNDEQEINYITMDSFNENEQSTTNSEDGLTTTIYISDENDLGLIEKKVTVSSISAEDILEQLKACQSIPTSTQINSFKTYKSDDNLTIGVLDFSKDFYEFNLGSGFESMMLDSIAKTYIENFELDKFKILVDGYEYQSGHILFEEDDYYTPKSFN